VAVRTSLIACRVTSYGPFAAQAYEHIASLGLRHVEIRVPAPHELEQTRAALTRYGLSASTLQAACDLSRPDVAEQVAAQMPAFAALGCRIMFTTVKRGMLAPQTAYDRLRAAGDIADRHGVTIALETHPDLATNADLALETLRAVDHPRVRLNFDTANVYFYNRGANCLEQLRRVAPYVAALHLKDTDGGYRHRHFPALGAGIVDFAGVFDILDAVGFGGPCTLEIEGLEGEQKTEQLVRDRVAASVRYLRSLGRL